MFIFKHIKVAAVHLVELAYASLTKVSTLAFTGIAATVAGGVITAVDSPAPTLVASEGAQVSHESSAGRQLASSRILLPEGIYQSRPPSPGGYATPDRDDSPLRDAAEGEISPSSVTSDVAEFVSRAGTFASELMDRPQRGKDDTKPAAEAPAAAEKVAAGGGSPLITGEVADEEAADTTTPLTNSSVAFTTTWNFAANTASQYSISGTGLTIDDDGARLLATDYRDGANIPAGFLGGSHNGTVFDTNKIRLNLTGTPGNTAELTSDWAPKWSNLVWYWNMQGTGGVSTTPFPVTKGGTNCQTYSAAATYGNGKVNKAIQPPGTLYDLYCNAANVSTIANNMTISGWIKQTDGTPAAWSSLTSTGGGGSTQYLSFHRFSNSKILYIRVDTSAVSNAGCGTQRIAALDGNWHHVTFTLSSGIIKAYMDGTLLETCSYAHGSGFNSNYGTMFFLGLSTGGSTAIDEWAVWNTVLSGDEIREIYDRQAAAVTGIFTSRVFTATAPGAWDKLSWVTTLPFLKELSPGNESTANYSGLANSTLMSGIQGFWHFNETDLTSAAGGLKDSSGLGHHGTYSGATGKTGAGLFGNALDLVEISWQRASITLEDMSESFTYQLWINSADTSAWASSGMRVNAQGYGWRLQNENTSGKIYARLDTSGGANQTTCGAQSVASPAITDGRWHHIAMVVNNGNCKFFVDGKKTADVSYARGTGFYGPAELNVGAGLKARFDEVAHWGRNLSEAEVLSLYRRGANRLKLQVKSCTLADCSDGVWQGVSGEGSSTLSELHNNTDPGLYAGAGTAKNAAPLLLFPSLATIGLEVADALRFQYRAILESDDTAGQCTYGNCSPELSSVRVNSLYSTSNPSVSAFSGTSFSKLNSFGETLGTSGCSSVPHYALSADGGGSYYYWNGAAWETSNGSYDQASAASTLTASALGSFPATGSVTFRAHLPSDGSTPCQIDSVTVSGLK